MSSTERLLLILCFAAGITIQQASASEPASSKDNELTCPQTIEVSETAHAPTGWSVKSKTEARKFQRISIYNGKEGGQEFELAPDEQTEDHNNTTQVWHLRGYRTMNLFLRCRYSGTNVVLSRDIPASLADCIFRFKTDEHGRIVSASSFSCR